MCDDSEFLVWTVRADSAVGRGSQKEHQHQPIPDHSWKLESVQYGKHARVHHIDIVLQIGDSQQVAIWTPRHIQIGASQLYMLGLTSRCKKKTPMPHKRACSSSLGLVCGVLLFVNTSTSHQGGGRGSQMGACTECTPCTQRNPLRKARNKGTMNHKEWHALPPHLVCPRSALHSPSRRKPACGNVKDSTRRS